MEQGILSYTLVNTFKLDEKLEKDYYSIFDDFWITSKDKHFAFGYFFIDLIEFGSIQNNKIVITNSIGMKKAPNFHLYGLNKVGSKYEHNVENNIVYYENIISGDKYVYALYANVPFGDLGNEHSSLIEVYSWDGRAVAFSTYK